MILKKTYLLATIVLFGCIKHVTAQETTLVPIPTQAQLNWQNAELVAVFHYDLHVFDGQKYKQRRAILHKRY